MLTNDDQSECLKEGWMLYEKKKYKDTGNLSGNRIGESVACRMQQYGIFKEWKSRTNVGGFSRFIR